MSSGVKLTMYLSYYDQKNDMVVSPIAISKSCAQLLTSKRNHESNYLSKPYRVTSRIPVSADPKGNVRHTS